MKDDEVIDLDLAYSCVSSLDSIDRRKNKAHTTAQTKKAKTFKHLPDTSPEQSDVANKPVSTQWWKTVRTTKASIGIHSKQKL